MADPNRSPNDQLAQQAQFFSEATNIHDLPPSYAYWSRHYVEPHLKALFGVEDDLSFYARLAFDHAERTGTPLRLASLGCGEGRTEIGLCKHLLAMGCRGLSFACIDIAPGAIARAQDAAQREGLGEILSFSVGDFRDFLVGSRYDIVIANQILHHVEDLAPLFDTIRAAIGTDGLFISIDMIGRNGHMLWPEALAIIDRVWRTLPRKYKYHHLFQRFEDVYSNWDNSKEGNEGIHSQDILGLLLAHFTFEGFLAVGNLAPALFGRGFGPNFDPDIPEDRALIETICRVDRDLIDLGYLKPVLMYAVMSCRDGITPILLGHQSPAFCLREAKDYTLFSEQSEYPLGTRMHFGERDKATAFLGAGWSSPETGGTWSNSSRSTVCVPVSYFTIPTKDFALTVRGFARVSPDSGQQVVEVFVNDHAVGTMRFTETHKSKEFTFLTGAAIDRVREIVIEFRYSDPRSSVELGVSNDPRRLALFLESMMVAGAPPPPSPPPSLASPRRFLTRIRPLVILRRLFLG